MTRKCQDGHEWSNQFGENWTPEPWMRCDCGEKSWEQSLVQSAMTKNKHAVALGRKGGRVKSPAKTAAAQANIRKRWTPRYCEMCDETVRASTCPACGMSTQPIPEETPEP